MRKDVTLVSDVFFLGQLSSSELSESSLSAANKSIWEAMPEEVREELEFLKQVLFYALFSETLSLFVLSPYLWRDKFFSGNSVFSRKFLSWNWQSYLTIAVSLVRMCHRLGIVYSQR